MSRLGIILVSTSPKGGLHISNDVYPKFRKLKKCTKPRKFHYEQYKEQATDQWETDFCLGLAANPFSPTLVGQTKTTG